jgi:hypothetical protein
MLKPTLILERIAMQLCIFVSLGCLHASKNAEDLLMVDFDAGELMPLHCFTTSDNAHCSGGTSIRFPSLDSMLSSDGLR